MEFLGPHHSYLKRLSISFLHSYLNTELRQASSLPTVYVSTGEEAADALRLHREKLEAELEELTTQTLARSKRRSKYKAVTVPSSVKHQVTESAPAMARPRSPQRKNDADLQGMLDEQLAAIRRQLTSLSSERTKMEHKMEDLVNGIKEVSEQSANFPRRIVITSSTPGSIRRVQSMEGRKKNMVKRDSERSLGKLKSSAYHRQMSGPDEVDGEGWPNRQRFASVSSTGSSREGDVASLSDSLNSSRVSSSTASSSIRRLQLPPISDYMDGHPSPTPIPELPESPSISRSATPRLFIPHSPLHRPRSTSSTTPPSANKLDSSPKHQRMYSQPSPIHPSLAQSLLSPTATSGGGGSTSRPRSGSFSMLASPKLALKATLSSQDLRNRAYSSPVPSKKRSSPGSKLKHHKKDQQLSYFRKNSFTDLESSLKGSQTSIATDEECELKGSRDNMADFGASSGDQESPTLPPGSNRGTPRILRRSSLTGQIEHVANLRTQLRRNNSFNTSAVTSASGAKHHFGVKEQRSLSVQEPRKSLTPTAPRRVVYLRSKETTV